MRTFLRDRSIDALRCSSRRRPMPASLQERPRRCIADGDDAYSDRSKRSNDVCDDVPCRPLQRTTSTTHRWTARTFVRDRSVDAPPMRLATPSHAGLLAWALIAEASLITATFVRDRSTPAEAVRDAFPYRPSRRGLIDAASSIARTRGRGRAAVGHRAAMRDAAQANAPRRRPRDPSIVDRAPSRNGTRFVGSFATARTRVARRSMRRSMRRNAGRPASTTPPARAT